MKKISISLATYNGSIYIKHQLDSIFNQTYKNFNLIVRDDQSKDNTLEILKSYNMSIVSADKNLGAKGSFIELLKYALEHSDTDYFMFCDQDDVWNTDKVEKTYLKMQELESIYGKYMPLLVHSNLTVADEKLDIIASSFWKYQNIDPSKDGLNRLLLHNVVTGCTMMINQALAEKIKTIPAEAIMHDWWIALVASVFGKIAYIDEPLMLYRQHGKNDTGAKHYGMQYFIKKFFVKPSFEKYILQSRAFLTLYGKELNENDRKMLEEFSEFAGLTKCQKLKVLYKYKIWKNGFIRNLGLVLFA